MDDQQFQDAAFPILAKEIFEAIQAHGTAANQAPPATPNPNPN